MTRARDLANLIGSGNYTSTTFTATAGQTVFTIAHTPNFIQVFMNGLLLDETTDYTSNGTAVTLTSAATAGDELEVVKYNTFSVGDAITQTAADSRYVNTTGDTMTGTLDVQGTITADGLTVDGSSSIRHTDATTNISLTPTSTGGVVNVRDSSGNSQILLDARTTQVGIGTSSPTSVIHASSASNTAINLQTSNASSSVSTNYTSANRTFYTGVDIGGANSAYTVYDGTAGSERMRIDSAGRVTMPYQPSWSLSRGTNQYYATTGGAVIPFYNTGNYVGRHVTGVTSNGSGRITVPVSGRYQINATIYFTRSSGTNDGYAYIMINGAADLWSGSAYAGTGTYYDTITFSQMINLSTNDYLEIHAGGQLYSIYGASTFSGYLVG